MGFWADLSVNIKILVAISVASLVALVVGMLGLNALADSSAAAQRIYSSNLAGVSALGAVRNGIIQSRLDLALHVVYEDQKVKDGFEATFADNLAVVDDGFAAYESAGPVVPAETVAEVRAAWQSYVTIARDELIPASQDNDLTAWGTIRTEQVGPVVKELTALLTEIGAAEQAAAATSAGSAADGYRTNRVEVIGMLVAGIGAALALGFLVARAIVRSLRRVIAVEEQTATTGEMSRSVADAATSSGDVARTVSGVAEVASATADGARATQQAAADLTRLAGDLNLLVGGFRH